MPVVLHLHRQLSSAPFVELNWPVSACANPERSATAPPSGQQFTAIVFTDHANAALPGTPDPGSSSSVFVVAVPDVVSHLQVATFGFYEIQRENKLQTAEGGSAAERTWRSGSISSSSLEPNKCLVWTESPAAAGV